MESEDKLKLIENACEEKKAIDLVVMNLRGKTLIADFFVLCTGRNARQTKAIYDEVAGRLKAEEGAIPRSVDGATEGVWIVVDYLDKHREYRDLMA